MVGTIKRWLGIDVLERENVRLAQAVLAQRKRIDEIPSLDDHEARIAYIEKDLTSEKEKPKIEPKPKARNWKTFRSQVEQATEPQEPQ